MSFFNRLLGREPRAGNNPGAPPPEQAVLIYLKSSGLPDEVYEKYDVATLEDRLRAVIEQDQLGEFDGDEIRETETVLFMYGPNAERLFAGIGPTLRSYPLCQEARVVIRPGPPGTASRELQL